MQTIDLRGGTNLDQLNALRQKLSPRGDVVSDAGRRRTIEVFGEPLSPTEVVRLICDQVRDRGIDAVLEFSAKLDGSVLRADDLRTPMEDFAAAHAAASPSYLSAVRMVRDNVLRYQRAIRRADVQLASAEYPGEDLRLIHRPVRRVGVCVPGGAAAYPSTLLMTVLPAMAAGVKEIAVMAPPTANGAYNQALLAACHEVGVRELYRMGGAQGVAALAFGVEGVRAVDMIVGPGNLFVALAKRMVSGEVGIDSIAGPSEVLVLADDSADAAYIAADLIAQAEHAPGSAILVTWNEPLAAEVQAELALQLASTSRSLQAMEALAAFGAVVLVDDEASGILVSNKLAPEHLEIHTRDSEAVLAKIDNAGAVFLGSYSPTAVGDYVAGPSHTLPTGGSARFASVLSVNTFLKEMSVVKYSKERLEEVRRTISILAEIEGLAAHARSVDIRFDHKTK